MDHNDQIRKDLKKTRRRGGGGDLRGSERRGEHVGSLVRYGEKEGNLYHVKKKGRQTEVAIGKALEARWNLV